MCENAAIYLHCLNCFSNLVIKGNNDKIKITNSSCVFNAQFYSFNRCEQSTHTLLTNFVKFYDYIRQKIFRHGVGINQ